MFFELAWFWSAVRLFGLRLFGFLACGCSAFWRAVVRLLGVRLFGFLVCGCSAFWPAVVRLFSLRLFVMTASASEYILFFSSMIVIVLGVKVGVWSYLGC